MRRHGQGGTAAGLRRRGLYPGQIRLDSTGSQCLAHHIHLPTGDKFIRRMLQRTAAAAVHVATGCLHPVRAGRDDLRRGDAVAVQLPLDDLPGQATRDKDWPIGNAVAPVSQPGDRDLCHVNNSSFVRAKPEAIQRASKPFNRAPSAAP